MAPPQRQQQCISLLAASAQAHGCGAKLQQGRKQPLAAAAAAAAVTGPANQSSFRSKRNVKGSKRAAKAAAAVAPSGAIGSVNKPAHLAACGRASKCA
jgi:hypothetical protein